MHFQPGEGPSRGLLRDCTTGCETDGSFYSTSGEQGMKASKWSKGSMLVTSLLGPSSLCSPGTRQHSFSASAARTWGSRPAGSGTWLPGQEFKVLIQIVCITIMLGSFIFNLVILDCRSWSTCVEVEAADHVEHPHLDRYYRNFRYYTDIVDIIDTIM